MNTPSPNALEQGFTVRIDVAALEASGGFLTERPPAPRAGNRLGSHRFEAPGVIAQFGADCSVHVDGSVLAIACGSAAFRSESLDQVRKTGGAAAAWIEAYKIDGEQLVGHACGHYCLTLVDASRKCVLLATDRFAVHPLCYGIDGTRIAVSDRADRVPTDTARRVRAQALYEYLYFQMIPAPGTVFDGVSRLRAATLLRFDSQRTRVERHWQPEFGGRAGARFETLRAEFRDALARSVSREAQGNRAGCFLSGGTDSSTVAGLLSQSTGAPPETFSIGFEAEGYDEMEYARIAARHFGARHHEYYVRPDDIVESWPEVAAHFDQPFGNSSALPALYCAKLARSHGIERMLAGDGGDELFGGNARYAKQRVFDLYNAVPAALQRHLLEPILMSSVASSAPVLKKAASYIRQARVPMPDRLETYNLLERLGVEKLLNARFRAQVDTAAPARQQRTVYEEALAPSLIDRMLAYDWKYTLADNDLIKVSGATELAGVPVGFPLLSDELVDFSLRLVPSLKLKGLTLRYFFKEALRGFLPDEIIAKKKHGFGLPFGPWLVRHAELQALVRERFSSLSRRGIAEPAYLDELLSVRLAEHPGYYGGMVWLLVTLELWLQAHAPEFRID